MKTAVKKTELNKRLDIFFDREIDASDFALYVRKFLHESIKMMLLSDVDTFNKKVFEGGYYWINELCELIDPYLQSKEEIEQYLNNRE